MKTLIATLIAIFSVGCAAETRDPDDRNEAPVETISEAGAALTAYDCELFGAYVFGPGPDAGPHDWVYHCPDAASAQDKVNQLQGANCQSVCSQPEIIDGRTILLVQGVCMGRP